MRFGAAARQLAQSDAPTCLRVATTACARSCRRLRGVQWLEWQTRASRRWRAPGELRVSPTKNEDDARAASSGAREERKRSGSRTWGVLEASAAKTASIDRGVRLPRARRAVVVSRTPEVLAALARASKALAIRASDPPLARDRR